MTRRRQDPWSNDPIVDPQTTTPTRPASQVGDVVRRPDGTSYAVASREYTTETPEQRRARGYEQDENGTWYRTVGRANLEGLEAIDGVRSPDAKAGTSRENPLDVNSVSPTTLLKLAGEGAWLRYPDGRVERGSVSTQIPEGAIPVAPGVTRSPEPWNDDPVLTQSQINAERRAQELGQADSMHSGGAAFYQGASLGFADEAAGYLSGWGQAARNLGRRALGQEIEINSEDLRNAVTRNVRAEVERFARERPVSNFGLQALGGLTTGGVAGGGRATVANAARVGAGYGAGYGFGSGEGSFADRLPGAAVGGVVGAATGGALQGGLNVASPYAQRLLGIVGNSTRPAREALGRAFNRGAPDPQAGAAQRLLRDIDIPAAVSERERLVSLGLNPTVMDVAGGTTERTIRMAAGPAGPAAERAVENSVGRAANLKPEIMATTRGIVDDPRSAQAVRQGLEETRDALATTQYAEPYAASVRLTPEAQAALRGRDGQAAIERAMRGAEANQNYEELAELQGLLGGDAIEEVSGRTLDRVRIALRDMSSNFLRGDSPDRVMAAGYANRVAGVDTALDAAPGLVEARDTFRNLSGAIDAIDNRPDVFSTDPRDFAAWVRNLTPEQRQAATVGVRQDILDTLGGQRNAGTGSIDRLAQSQYSRENLSALLGEQEAGQYLASVGARVAQAQRAARVSPNTNSQTFGRAMDEGNETAGRVSALVDATGAFRGDIGGLARTIDRIRARATMTPQEREAIVEMGLGSADDLERIVRLAESALSSRRPPPREVRAYITSIRNTLGAQSPVVQQIETLLLPAPVSAEEQR